VVFKDKVQKQKADQVEIPRMAERRMENFQERTEATTDC